MTTFSKGFLGLILACCLGASVYAAEIRGQVLFTKGSTGFDQSLVVLLLARDSGKRFRKHDVVRVDLRNRRFSRRLLVIRPGDRMRLVNHDDVSQVLVLIGHRGRKSVRLGPGRNRKRRTAEIRFTEHGEWHLFSTLDNSLYARIVVMDAERITYTMVGKSFEFRRLAAGRRRLRILTLTGRDLDVVADAYTAPSVIRWRVKPARSISPAKAVDTVLAVADLYRGRAKTR